MPLSDAKIRTLKPADKDFKVADAGGLFLLMKASGSKSWRMKYRLNGKEGLLVIGDYPAITLAQARATRDAAKVELAAGSDPNAAKQELKRIKLEVEAETFEKQAKAYISKTMKEGKAIATLAKTEWLLGIAFADFGSKPIVQVTSPMILACLRKVEAKGNYETAKRLRAVIGAVFRYAIANGSAETDPTYALRDAIIRPTVTPRAAITEVYALGGLLRAIEGFHGHAFSQMPRATDIELRDKALFAFLLLTGARDGAIASLRLKRVDLVEGCVYQDARDVKTKFAKTFTTWFLPVDQGYLDCFTGWVNHLRHDLLFGHDDALFPKPQMGHLDGDFAALGLSREIYTNANKIREIIKAAFTTAGLPAFAPHSFRKTLVKYGDQRCQTREQFKAWSLNLGHDSVVTTISAYCPISKERQAELIRGMV